MKNKYKRLNILKWKRDLKRYSHFYKIMYDKDNTYDILFLCKYDLYFI